MDERIKKILDELATVHGLLPIGTKVRTSWIDKGGIGGTIAGYAGLLERGGIGGAGDLEQAHPAYVVELPERVCSYPTKENGGKFRAVGVVLLRVDRTVVDNGA